MLTDLYFFIHDEQVNRECSVRWMKSIQNEAEHNLKFYNIKIFWGFYETLYVTKVS